jgi:NAD(P)-dependent dehydrogenase (short-subunit alcohol dehydrogenase family)
MTRHQHRPLALVTGGSAGLGRALVHALPARGWTVVTDGRDAARLTEAIRDLDNVAGVPGDIADGEHRAHLVDAVRRLAGPDGGLDLLVHNASTLGPLPMPRLADLETGSLAAIWHTNAGAPHALTRVLLPDLLAAGGILLSLSSDAAVQHYPGWGGYGAAKAALDHLTLTFAEETGVTAYAVDPGDMDTQLHRDAEPGEDLSHLPGPEGVVPHLLALIESRPASGRYRAADIPANHLTGAALMRAAGSPA